MNSVVLLDFDDVFNISTKAKNSRKKLHLRSGWDPDAWRNATFSYPVPSGTKAMRSNGAVYVIPEGTIQELPITYNTEAVRAVNELAEEGVEVLWQTSWAHSQMRTHAPGIYSTEEFDLMDGRESKRFLETLGFAEFDAVDADGIFHPSTGMDATKWWKYRATEFVVGTGRWDVVTWLDNDLFRQRGRSLMQEYCAIKNVELRYANRGQARGSSASTGAPDRLK